MPTATIPTKATGKEKPGPQNRKHLHSTSQQQVQYFGKLKNCTGTHTPQSKYVNINEGYECINCKYEKDDTSKVEEEIILQVDGNISSESDSTDEGNSTIDDSDTDYVTDEEVEPELIAANFSPIPDKDIPLDGAPIKLDVKPQEVNQSSFIPLCLAW